MPELYKFNKLREFLINLGVIIRKSDRVNIVPEDFVAQYKKGNITFKKDFIIFIDANKQEIPVYMYQNEFNVTKYGLPKMHICKCSTIREFIDKKLFEKKYVSSNSPTVEIVDKKTGDIYTDCKLDLCYNCKKELLENWSKNIGDIDDYAQKIFDGFRRQEKRREIRTDIFGYDARWNIISERIRKENEYTCEYCKFKARNTFQKSFIEVHHKNKNKLDNRIENLIVLCIKCHSEIDSLHEENYSKGVNKARLEKFCSIKNALLNS